MKYILNDTFVLNNVECKVKFINANGNAYLVPTSDEYIGAEKVFKGLVYAVLDPKGKDIKTGKKAIAVSRIECGAV